MLLFFLTNRGGTRKFDFPPTASTSLCFVVDGLLEFLQGFFWGIEKELGSLIFLQRLHQVCFVVDEMFFIFALNFLRNRGGEIRFSSRWLFFFPVFLVVDGETDVEKHDFHAFDKTQFQTHFMMSPTKTKPSFNFTIYTQLWLTLNIICNQIAKQLGRVNDQLT